MASITVRVGREEKEISGLTKRTTCWDVVLALLKDKQNLSGTDGFSADGERPNSALNTGDETGSASSSTTKSVKELAQSYCIVESWRGLEKPIPPRTRILHIMQVLEKQRGQVNLSLKKSKHIAYNNIRQMDFKGDISGNLSLGKDANETSNYAARLSQHQKRRIRRNLKQYKRAILSKSSDGQDKSEDYLNNNKQDAEGASDATNNSQSNNKNYVLSEELFVDGVICDTLVRPDRAELINLGTFNQEYCTYRRRGKHNRRGSIDSASMTFKLRRDSVPHFPYSHHHRRRRSRSSKNRNGKSSRRYSDDTSTTTTATSISSEDEKADDADDEKSVLTEYVCTNNVRLPRNNFNPTLVPCMENAITDLSTTATDSSTTTSGDSISSNGCSTSSGSSEASSWGDCALDRSIREYCANNGVNFKPGVIQPPQRLLKNNDNFISPEVLQKPKKSKSILGIFETTFRRSNSKRNSKLNKKSQLQNKKSQNILPNKQQEITNKSHVATQQTSISIETPIPENPSITTLLKNSTLTEDEQKEAETRDQLLQTLLSQKEHLATQQNRLAASDVRIEQIETDIHQLREQAHGKNYVQNAYMSEGQEQTDYLANLMSSPCGPPVSSKWILDCENTDEIEKFIEASNEIVKVQMQIEEYQRKVDIILQDMQEEVWRVSAESCPPTRVSSATAALVFGKFDEDDEISDDESRHERLSVCNSLKLDLTKIDSYDKTSQNKNGKLEGITSIEAETIRTELETSYYFSLRLTSELDEVDHRLMASDHLIQHKGEELIQTVREIAMSPDGISPEMWEEYGDLLTAYDLEVQHREYLEMVEAAEAVASSIRESEADNTYWPHLEAYRIDATSPTPTIHLPENRQHVLANKEMSNHNDVVPWGYCEHCHMKENIKHRQSKHHITQEDCHKPASSKNQQFFAPPRSFSELPLPSVKKPSVGQPLLPMLPISTLESDNEDLADQNARNTVNSQGISFHGSDMIPSSSSNSTDDSGNASAESTSSDGSRNSSCDGGSPRPYPEDKTTNAFFASRNNSVRGSWKDKFSFQRKADAQSSKHGKAPPPPPPAHTKPTLVQKNPPKLPPKPQNMSSKQIIRRGSMSSPSLSTMHQGYTKNADIDQSTLQQQQKLIRKNTATKGKPRFNNQQQILPHSASSNSMGSFAPRGGSFRDSRIKNNLSMPFADARINSRSTTPITVVGPSSMSVSTKRILPEKPAPRATNYDNDSDTGLSSLHSTDSDQIIYSETLV